MRLYVLASGKDAKGTQLEYLTKAILESLGYQDVVRNEVGSGGDEIDVSAKWIKPSINGDDEYPLICECKAHENPITINDWDKFLGKVFKHQKSNPKTQGLMIALSDANGNVKGDIREIAYNDVKLLQGSHLIESLSKAFSLESEMIAREEVLHLTNETVVTVDLVLYENEIYWLFAFASGTFSVFNKNYKSLSPKVEAAMLPLLAQYSSYKSEFYKNVRNEAELVERRNLVKLVACWRLMNGSLSFQDVISDVVFMTRGGIIPEMRDVEEVIPLIPFADTDSAAKTVTLKDTNKIDYVEFYHFLLAGPIPLFLYDDYFQQHIDEGLLDKVLSIQYGLRLSDEDRVKCLFILRHSPSALLYALNPDVLIQTSVKMDVGNKTCSARNHFMEKLLSCLEADFKGEMHSMVVEHLGLREFKKEVSIRMVDKVGESEIVDTKERLIVMPVDYKQWAIVKTVENFEGEYDAATGTFKT